MKVCINTTTFCFYLAFYLYAEEGVWGFSVDEDCMYGSKDHMKCSSTSYGNGRAAHMEKHDILHSFNDLKKSIAAFRHDFLLILIVCLRQFLWSYFNDKCPERII